MIHDSICESEKLNKVSLGAEALWVRILTVVDDNGNYDRDPLVVYATCLRFKEGVTVKDVEKWLKELIEVRSDDEFGLLAEYVVKGRSYIHIVNFRANQALRDDKTITVSFPPHPVSIQDPAYMKTGKGSDVIRKEAVSSPSPARLQPVSSQPENGLEEEGEGEVKERREVEGEDAPQLPEDERPEPNFVDFQRCVKQAVGVKPKPFPKDVERYSHLSRKYGEQKVLDGINTSIENRGGKSAIKKKQWFGSNYLQDDAEDILDARIDEVNESIEKTANANRPPAVQI